MTDRTPEQHAAFLQAFISDVEDTIAAPMPADLDALQEARDTVSALARLAAEEERLREALRDFEKHGLRCDLHPTMPLNNVEGLYLRFSEYLERQDASARERARAALASPPADTEQP